VLLEAEGGIMHELFGMRYGEFRENLLNYEIICYLLSKLVHELIFYP
jgi:hypothetical protein